MPFELFICQKFDMNVLTKGNATDRCKRGEVAPSLGRQLEDKMKVDSKMVGDKGEKKKCNGFFSQDTINDEGGRQFWHWERHDEKGRRLLWVPAAGLEDAYL